jgi:ketosteroid isomerase-like protein
MKSQAIRWSQGMRPWLGVIVLALAGCHAREGALPDALTTALASAFTRGDAEACAALYTKDAVIYSGNAGPISGQDAIKAFFRDQVARDILFSTDSQVSLVEGELAIDQGTYRVRDTRRGVDVEYGQYLNVWRSVDGNWRVFRSMYNVMHAPRAGGSVSSEEDPPVTSPTPRRTPR